MTVPYSFGTATTAIPLSQLDSNFNTPITLGNTAIQLGNTVTTLNNMTLANVAITSVATTFPNNYLANSSVTIGSTNISLGGTATTVTGLTLTSPTINGGTSTATQNLANVTGTLVVSNGGTGQTTFTSGQVLYGNGTSGINSSSNLTFDGTNITVNGLIQATGSPSNPTGTTVSFYNGSGVGPTISGYQFAVRTGGTPSEAMRIDSSGSLGVGITSPSTYAKIATASTVTLTADSSYGISISDATTLAKRMVLGYYPSGGSTGYGFGVIQGVYTGTSWTDIVLTPNGGNVGIGVTPSAWAIGKTVQINNASIMGYLNRAYFNTNIYFATGAVPTYIASDYANSYQQVNGAHQWFNAPSGTAGSAISFTLAMALNNSGNLNIGNTTAGYSSATNLGSIVAQQNGSNSVNICLVNTTNDAYTYITNDGTKFSILS